MSGNYQYQPKRVIVYGHTKIGLSYNSHEYNSCLEAKMAVLLIHNGVRFKPHIKFVDLLDKEGKVFSYELDFLFEKPQKFGLMDCWVLGIEVKGVLSYNDIKRIDALAYWKNIPVYIATPAYIECWEREGLRKNASIGRMLTPQIKKEVSDNV